MILNRFISFLGLNAALLSFLTLLLAVSSIAVSDEYAPINFGELRERRERAVFQIEVHLSDLEGNPLGQPKTGTAFLVAANGTVLTAKHIFEGMSEDKDTLLHITLHNESASASAKLISVDPVQDFALLRADSPFKTRPLCFGNSNKVNNGAVLWKLGYPGPRATTAIGHLSDKQTEVWETTASFNPGDSGAPVFDHNGDVVGLAIGGIPGEQLRGFLIPEAHTRLARSALNLQSTSHCDVKIVERLADLSGIVPAAFAMMIIFRLVQLGSSRVKSTLAAKITGQSLNNIYFDNMSRWLDWMDRKFGRHPFSPTSFDWCLRISFIYPLLSALVVWGAFGVDASGIEGAFAFSAPPAVRVAALVGLIAATCCMIAALNSVGFRSGVLVAVGLVIVATIIVAVGEFLVAASLCAVAIAGAVTASGFLAEAGSGRGYMAAAVGKTNLLTEIIVVLGGGFVALTVFVVTAAASAPPGQELISSCVGAILAVSAIVAFAYAEDIFCKKDEYALFFLLYWLVFVSVIFLGVAYAASGIAVNDANKIVAPLIIFWATLPLINVVFDWVSLGITRSLLRVWLFRKGRYLAIALAILDLCCALILMALLGFAMVIALKLLNVTSVASGGKELIDLNEVLKNLANNPDRASNLWIYATLFSTILPSFAHWLIAAAAAATIPFSTMLHERVYRAILSDRSPLDPLWIAILLTLRDFTSLAIAAGALTALVWGAIEFAPGLGPYLLSLAQILTEFIDESVRGA